MDEGDEDDDIELYYNFYRSHDSIDDVNQNYFERLENILLTDASIDVLNCSIELGLCVSNYEKSLVFNSNEYLLQLEIDRDAARTIIHSVIDNHVAILIAWESSGMLATDTQWSVTKCRLEKWDSFSPTRKWLERTCDLLNSFMPPSKRLRNSPLFYSFPFAAICSNPTNEMENSCGMHVTWFLSLCERVNRHFCQKRAPFELCAFSSLEHVWIGFSDADSDLWHQLSVEEDNSIEVGRTLLLDIDDSVLYANTLLSTYPQPLPADDQPDGTEKERVEEAGEGAGEEKGDGEDEEEPCGPRPLSSNDLAVLLLQDAIVLCRQAFSLAFLPQPPPAPAASPAASAAVSPSSLPASSAARRSSTGQLVLRAFRGLCRWRKLLDDACTLHGMQLGFPAALGACLVDFAVVLGVCPAALSVPLLHAAEMQLEVALRMNPSNYNIHVQLLTFLVNHRAQSIADEDMRKDFVSEAFTRFFQEAVSPFIREGHPAAEGLLEAISGPGPLLLENIEAAVTCLRFVCGHATAGEGDRVAVRWEMVEDLEDSSQLVEEKDFFGELSNIHGGDLADGLLKTMSLKYEDEEKSFVVQLLSETLLLQHYPTKQGPDWSCMSYKVTDRSVCRKRKLDYSAAAT